MVDALVLEEDYAWSWTKYSKFRSSRLNIFTTESLILVVICSLTVFVQYIEANYIQLESEFRYFHRLWLRLN